MSKKQHPVSPAGLAAVFLLSTQAFAVSLSQEQSFEAFRRYESKIGKRAAATEDCDDQCQSMRQEFRYAVWVGKEIYCYWDEKRAQTGTDFDALAREIEAGIRTGTSFTGYYLALRRWAAAFQDGHVNVMANSWTLPLLEIYSSDVRLETLATGTDQEKLIVSQVAKVPGLSVGDEVLRINGVESRKALDQAETQVSGSTRVMRRARGTGRLVDVLGMERASETLRLAVRSAADPSKEIEVEIPRTVALAPSAGSGSDAPAETGAEYLQVKVLPGNLGYLRIDAFGGTQMAALLDQAMRRLSGTKGLLIDVRQNGGGDQSGNAVLSWLSRFEMVRYYVSERLSPFLLFSRGHYAFYPRESEDAPYASWRPLRVKPSQDGSYAGKPVVALTGPLCFSACDTFVSALQANGLAAVVGEATGGGTGTPLVFELPLSDLQFRYSVVRGKTARGAPIEGVGTLPDVRIEQEASEILMGQDQVLAKSLELLASRVGVAQPKPLDELRDAVLRMPLSPNHMNNLSSAPTISELLELQRSSKATE